MTEELLPRSNLLLHSKDVPAEFQNRKHWVDLSEYTIHDVFIDHVAKKIKPHSATVTPSVVEHRTTFTCDRCKGIQGQVEHGPKQTEYVPTRAVTPYHGTQEDMRQMIKGRKPVDQLIGELNASLAKAAALEYVLELAYRYADLSGDEYHVDKIGNSEETLRIALTEDSELVKALLRTERAPKSDYSDENDYRLDREFDRGWNAALNAVIAKHKGVKP